MKKKTKKLCKILSVFLALLIAIQILPLQVLAENIANLLSNQETTNTSVDENSAVSILYEVEEKRDEYTKVYKKSDGTYTAVKTVEPLHYLNDGVWEEINNSMSLNGNLYTNLNNLFNVEFPESIDSNENLTVEKDGYELSFTVDEIEESSAVIKNDIVVSETNIAVADEAISQTQSSVTYNDVTENTDLQYIVTPNSIKENIIVSNKESVKDTYTFTFETNGLDAEKLDDGDVVFIDDNGEVKFRIPRPIMTDSSLAFSYDICVTLIENGNGTVTLEYSPSRDWTNSSERTYPITIDPAITVDGEEPDFIEDTFVEYNRSKPSVAEQNHVNDYLTILTKLFTKNENNENVLDMESKLYTKIDTEFFKNLGNDIVFTEVQYIIAGATNASGKLFVNEILDYWDVQTVNYNDNINLSNEVIDYYTSPLSEGEEFNNFVYVHFNITDIFNEWFNGKTNNGFAITAAENTASIMIVNGGSQNTAMVLDYVEIGGYNENLNYHTQSAGRAGTGYVNDFTQRLSVIRNDIYIADNNFPVTIGMIYNSASYDKLESLNYSNMMAYGNNWTPNYLRAYLTNDENNFTYYTFTGATIDFTRSIDKQGNVIFKEQHANIYGNHGYELEYHSASEEYGEHYTINRPDGYIEKFNSDGLLTSVTKLVYTKQTENGSNEQSTLECIEKSTKIEYDKWNRIDNITDFDGRVFDYVYYDDLKENDKKLLSKITYYTSNNQKNSPLEIVYSYDEKDNLTKVTFPDKKSVEYNYENGNMKTMTNIDGYRIAYEYEEKLSKNHDREETIKYTDRITNVVEQAKNGTDYDDGNSITYERLNTNQIKLTDATGDYAIYHFGTYGNLLYTTNNDGNYVMHEDVDSTNETHFASVSDYRSYSENLLSNPSFEVTESNNTVLKDWEIQKNVLTQTNRAKITPTKDEPALFGFNVLQINCYKNHTIGVKQSVEIPSSGYYTLSAYVKAETEQNGSLSLKISYDEESNNGTTTTPVTTTNGNWERFTSTIYVPEGKNIIDVELIAENGGTFFIDGVQLEQSSFASFFNYVTNGSFNKKYHNWTTTNTIEPTKSTINGKNVNAIKIAENTDKETIITQTVTIDGKANDIIRVGGWFNGNFNYSSTNNVWLKNIMKEPGNNNICNFTYNRYASIEVICEYDNSDLTEVITIPFSENINGWQFAAKEILLQRNCSNVIINIRCNQLANDSMFSNIELTKKKIRTTTYDSNDKPCPCVKCTIVDCSCSCDSELYCYCSQCMQREQNIKDYNFANMSLGNNNDEIISTQMLTQRVGNNVTVNFNLSNGLLKSVYDATKTYSSYIYNNSGTITQISSDNSNVIFNYYNDKLQSINQNGTIYNFNYDIWGQLTQVSIGSTPLVSYKYGSYENRDRIIEVCYHNNDSTNNTTTFDYNDELNIITISINEQEKFTCNYDENGLLTEIFDVNGREVYYTVNGTEIYDSPNNLLYSSYQKNNGDIIETIDNSIFTTNGMSAGGGSGSYHDNRNIISKNGKIIGVTANIDDVGRYSSSIVQTEKFNDNDYDDYFAAIINAIDYDSTEKSIIYETCAIYDKRIYINSDKISYYRTIYDYDDNGNIIQKTVKNAIDDTIISNTSYAYTNQNQLTRVNDETNNITYYYSYTAGGNIDYIQEYPYTTGELKDTDVDKTINYNYTNDVWKDRLTDIVCDEQTLTNITYDSIGNPLTINGKTLTWNGKQLKTYVDGNKAINYEYDVNGFCYKKTVTNNNVTEIYDYIWNEGKLISQVYNIINENTSEKYILKFAYDVFGTPYGFIVNDPNNNETVYLFMKNHEGDIVGIANEFGNTVLTYEYNIWGVTRTNTDNIGNEILKNIVDTLPLRYRGYCYDNDTGLYYIQGRYYSPEICRFINADNTSNLGSTGTALSYNLYAYCENNPMMYVVDNKNNEFSNTINSNYLYNKSISDNISGYIDDQGNGVASKLRYGLDSIGPVGCGCVASYNALIMLGNRIEIHDIIREYELNSLMYYGKWGVYPYNIARFFTSRGYKVTITDLREFDLKNNTNLTDSDKLNQIVSTHDANIMLYTHRTAAHYIAIKYDRQINKFVKYNINKTSDNVKDFISSDEQARLLISISVN